MTFTSKLLCLTVALVALCATFAMVQSSEAVEIVGVEKHFMDDGLGGECILKNVKLTVDGQTVGRTFEVEVPEEGRYYVTAWVMGIHGQKGIQPLQVYFDAQTRPIGDLKMPESGWQCVQLANRIFLTKGTHSFSFRHKGPTVPGVEFVRLAKREADAVISDVHYRNYIEHLKTQRLPDDYAQLKNDRGLKKPATPDPETDYAYALNADISYTYHLALSFPTAGTNVVFETKKQNPTASDPVMYFYHCSDAANGGSWVDDNGGEGLQSKIDCTTQLSGVHMLVIRSRLSSYPGTSDLWIDGSLYAEDVAVAGKRLTCFDYMNKTGELNYFTCKLASGSRTGLWVTSGTSHLGPIKDGGHCWNFPGDFNWGYASRIRETFSPAIGAVLVAEYCSYHPTGQCDVYMALDNWDRYPYQFPDLEDDDAIQSSPSSGDYNCYSWSGGRTDLGQEFNPSDPYSTGPPAGVNLNEWYDEDPLTAFDKFYGNTPPRYEGAPTYTRTGATAGNAEVALWKRNLYEHASVRKPANDQPHGYNWESKMGGGPRIMHPHAVGCSWWGEIDEYYRRGSAKIAGALAKRSGAGMTLVESVAAGLTIIPKVAFSDSEKAKLTKLIDGLPENVRQSFNARYEAWKATWTDPKLILHSNPEFFVQSGEYKRFLEYCRKQDKAIWPLLFQKFGQGDGLVRIPLGILIGADYGYIGIEVMEEVARNRYTLEGAYIAPSPKANWMRYLKRLLALSDRWGQLPESPEEKSGKASDVPEEFSVQPNFPNPFNPVSQIRYGLPSESLVSLKIYNVLGQEVALLVNHEVKQAGWHLTTWDGRDTHGTPVASGLYLCHLIAGDQVHIQKLVLTR